MSQIHLLLKRFSPYGPIISYGQKTIKWKFKVLLSITSKRFWTSKPLVVKPNIIMVKSI